MLCGNEHSPCQPDGGHGGGLLNNRCSKTTVTEACMGIDKPGNPSPYEFGRTSGNLSLLMLSVVSADLLECTETLQSLGEGRKPQKSSPTTSQEKASREQLAVL